MSAVLYGLRIPLISPFQAVKNANAPVLQGAENLP